MDTADKTILQAININKSFDNNCVLHNINFSLYKNEIHGIIGPNGAGKSTLIKIFSGVYRPDSGQVLYKNKRVVHNSPHISMKSGISVVYQELDLIPQLTVAENITLGLEKTVLGLFKTNINERKKALEVLSFLNAQHINPDSSVNSLSIADQQLTTIAKVLANKSDIIILDEPTAALSFREINNLFKIIKQLKNSKISLIYISHRLNELKDICDKISVLKDGSIVYSDHTAKISDEIIIKKLSANTGTKITTKKMQPKIEQNILQLRNISYKDKLKDISFSLNQGEIIGIAGFAGSGRTEILETIFGITQPDRGEIVIKNKSVTISTPEKAVRYGIGMVPENRKDSALFLQSTLNNNITFNNIKSYLFFSFFTKQRNQTKEAIARANKFSIKSKTINQEVFELSGGNQQKTVLGNWFFQKHKVILLDEPTRGIDLPSKTEIYSFIKEWQSKGTSFIIVSSEFSELVELCDRIIVLKDGKLIKEFINENISEHDIIKIILGHTFDEIHI